MISYLWQAGLSMALFYVLYVFLFKKLTFFRLNRTILLLIPIVSFILPWINFSSVDQISTSYILPSFSVLSDQINLGETISSTSMNTSSFVTYIYLTGLIASLCLNSR